MNVFIFKAPWIIDDRRPPRNWPDQGRVKFDEYSTRYREGLDLVLKGVDCEIAEGERVSTQQEFQDYDRRFVFNSNVYLTQMLFMFYLSTPNVIQ